MDKQYRRRHLMWVALVVVMAMVVAACGSQGESTTTTGGGGTTTPDGPGTTQPGGSPADREELVIRLATQDMQELDPAFLGVVGSWWVGHQIYSGLVRSDSGRSDPEFVKPDLAETWEVSDDGLTYTFHLRQGAQFHKGYGEVTANDVKFSYDRIMDPEVASSYAGLFEPIEEIEVVDDYTVVFHMESPYPAFLGSVLTYRPGYIVSQQAFEEKGQEAFSLDPIGSGPFVFESWTPNTEVVLSANDEFYLGQPAFSGVRMRVIQDESAVAIGIENGEIMAANIVTPEALAVLDGNPDVTLECVGSIAARYLWLNMKSGPTADPLVRQALWHATSTDLISEGVFDGWHTPLHTILPPSVWSWTDDVSTYEYDPELARQLLEQAGYPDGFDVSILYSQRPQDNGIAIAVQDMWRDIGVNVELIGLDHPVYTAERTENRDAYDFIMVHFGRDTDPNNFVQEVFHSSQLPPGSNAALYDTIDDLIEAGASEPDIETREAIYVELQERIQEDVPGIPLVHTTACYAVRNEIGGFEAPVHTGFAVFPLFPNN